MSGLPRIEAASLAALGQQVCSWPQLRPYWKQPQSTGALTDARDLSFNGQIPKWLSGIGNFYFHVRQLAYDPLTLISFFSKGLIWTDLLRMMSII